jgi:hypothetical protein
MVFLKGYAVAADAARPMGRRRGDDGTELGDTLD